MISAPRLPPPDRPAPTPKPHYCTPLFDTLTRESLKLISIMLTLCISFWDTSKHWLVISVGVWLTTILVFCIFFKPILSNTCLTKTKPRVLCFIST